MAAQEPDWLNRQILEHAPDDIIVADREGIIQVWNAGAGAVFAYRQRKRPAAAST
jgi:PAS domain S-box-containing protein